MRSLGWEKHARCEHGAAQGDCHGSSPPGKAGLTLGMDPALSRFSHPLAIMGPSRAQPCSAVPCLHFGQIPAGSRAARQGACCPENKGFGPRWTWASHPCKPRGHRELRARVRLAMVPESCPGYLCEGPIPASGRGNSPRVA